MPLEASLTYRMLPIGALTNQCGLLHDVAINPSFNNGCKMRPVPGPLAMTTISRSGPALVLGWLP